MKLQSSLLSAAIVSALAVSATAVAANHGAALKASAIARAHGMVDGASAAAVRRNAADAFVAADASVDASGTEHVRFARTYRGLPVIGGDFVMHSKNGQLKSVSQSLKTSARPDVVAKFSADQAIVEAGAHF